MELNTSNICINRPKIRYQYTQTLSNIFNILKGGILSSKCYQRDARDRGKLNFFKQHLYIINHFINKLQIIKNLQYLTDNIVLQKSGLIQSSHKLSVCHERISSSANAPFHVFQKISEHRSIQYINPDFATVKKYDEQAKGSSFTNRNSSLPFIIISDQPMDS